MGSADKKVNVVLSKEDVPKVLRGLADLVEGKDTVAGAGVYGLELNADVLARLKVSLKRDGQMFSVKIKAREEGPGDESAEGEGDAPEGGLPKYKTLKKRMKKSFETIVDAVDKGAPLPADTVDSFLEDSVLMTDYPDEGEEYYAEYDQAVAEFKKAYAAGDAGRLSTATAALVASKKRCHDKYK